MFKILSYKYRGFFISRILLIVFTSLIVSVPYPLKTEFSLKPIQADIEDKEKLEVEIETSAKPIGSSIFSSFTTIPLFSMPTSVCLDNENKIFMDGKEKKASELLDSEEGGAMNIEMYYSNKSEAFEIYAKQGTTSCEELDSSFGNLVFTGEAEIRNPLPYGKAVPKSDPKGFVLETEVFNQSEVDFSLTRVRHEILFSWEIYFLNSFIFLLFWVVLIQSWYNIKKFIYSSN